MKNAVLSVIAITLITTISGCDLKVSEPKTPQETTSDLSSLRTVWSSNYLADPTLPIDDQLKKSIQLLSDDVSIWLSRYQTQSQHGLWLDLPLKTDSEEDKTKIGDQLYKTYQRLFKMAQSYSLTDSDLYQNEELLLTIIDGLETLNKHYYKEGALEWGNWWHWQLGISRSANNILVLLYPKLPEHIIANYISATKYFVPSPTHLSQGEGAHASTAPKPFESTGANRVHNAQVVLIRSLLNNDQKSFIEAVETLEPVLEYVSKGDGFYEDGSFIQHTDLPYTGTYGNELLSGLGGMLNLVHSADWYPSPDKFNAIYPLILDTFSPFLVHGQMMDLVNGRAISRPLGQSHKIGHSILDSMLFYVESAPNEIRQQLKSTLKTHIQGDHFLNYFSNPRYMRNHQLALQIVNDSNVDTNNQRIEHRQFPSMDRVIHHRPDWSFAIAMHSYRVGNYECMNGENLRGWHTADGMNYLYNQQLDHYTDYWPIVNAYKLPGTTATDILRAECTGQLTGNSKRQTKIVWAGGSTLNQYGVVGFDFTNWDNTLSAKKSWFMFDNEIIALGSNISNNTAFTVLENRKINHDSVITLNEKPLGSTESFNNYLEDLQRLDITVDGQVNPITYLLLESHNAEINKVCTQGNYSDIGTSNLPVDGCFIEAILKHDLKNNYQYALLPNSAEEFVTNWVNESPISILRNDEYAHALQHKSLSISGYNFWQPSSVGMVTSAQPMSLMIKEHQNGKLSLAVSDPTQRAARVRFTLLPHYKVESDLENRVSFNSDGSISINTSDLRGSSYQFSLNKDV
ncbi:polysaccharide lyase 8 family protein [Vibrio alfacsensis]|uniref:polysaccharide lyase 8 family protein n=1 Tax=Vibrio TaxID=662 RepID=UPI004068DAA9